MKPPAKISLLYAAAPTAAALVCFAANSLLCRLALRGGEADPIGFATIRLVSGAFTLLAIVLITKRSFALRPRRHWQNGLWLFAYAFCFSIAYLQLSAGAGALILFGSVQLTMIAVSTYRGRATRGIELTGVVIALAGLIYLVLPGLAAPPLESSLLMTAAGAAWGFYTLRGKGSSDPISDTAGNFMIAAIVMLAVLAVRWTQFNVTSTGAQLAIVSGALASGIGYAVWYYALRSLTAVRAGALQLLVPIIAAGGAVLFLNEVLSTRLVVSAATVVGGIGLTLAAKK